MKSVRRGECGIEEAEKSFCSERFFKWNNNTRWKSFT